ncbi:MAG TPA: DUF6537 domain-containing protein, partial [Acidimicrobiales bacterium]|nr:DUF6537 domain-containing protein [Acidimicrobiales bacterium]
RRLRKRGLLPTPPRRVHINEAVCEGCGDCSVKSNCLSVVPHDTEFGEKRQIHDPSCNRDYTCLEGDCPSFVTLTPTRRGRSNRRAVGLVRPAPALPRGALPEPATSPAGSYGIYFTGIGGTGVVTANRIVAAAAEAAGFRIAGMDQTGLSQKAGAVVSHLHLLAPGEAPTTASVGPAGADLYLSGDILQAANPLHLAKAEPGRTTAVVNCDVTRTASMLQGGAAVPDVATLEQAVSAALGSDRVVFVDSTQIAEAVFADHLLANVVLLGAAFQRGALPLPLACLEDALGRQANPVRNRDAFTWGRWAAHDPEAVARAVRGAAPPEARQGGGIWDPSPGALRAARDLVSARSLPAGLDDLLVRRAAQVVDYQDSRRAARFLDLVERAAARDDAAEGWALTGAVASSWFKLLTYKDEYEVARLHLKADYDAVARDLGIEGSYRLRYHLHPPTLRRAGLGRKLPLGKPYEWGFWALARMRRLRGTPFDVFGWDRDRRLERALADEYEVLLSGLLAAAPGRPYDELVRIAASAESIRGYAAIKEEAARGWRAALGAELGHEHAPSPP